MKTTLEIPDAIFRRAKSAAAERGIPLREFVTEAVRDKLGNGGRDSAQALDGGFRQTASAAQRNIQNQSHG